LALERFTKAEVEYLVAAPKFIRVVPATRLYRPQSAAVTIIHAAVFKKSEPNNPVPGLIVMAKAREAPPGIPKPTPSAAPEWYGKRVRGLNYELWHDNPDGSIVKGWHEHIWSPGDQDSYVVPARPEITRRALLDVLKWGLEKWNIEVLEKQLEVFQ
jgi:hypothetical protein